MNIEIIKIIAVKSMTEWKEAARLGTITEGELIGRKEPHAALFMFSIQRFNAAD